MILATESLNDTSPSLDVEYNDYIDRKNTTRFEDYGDDSYYKYQDLTNLHDATSDDITEQESDILYPSGLCKQDDLSKTVVEVL